MKKLFIGSLVAVFMFAFTLNMALAAADSDPIGVSLTVTSTIAINCSESLVTNPSDNGGTVTMAPIAGYGQSAQVGSENEQVCRVRTNNGNGYSLAIKDADATTTLTSPSDTIAVITSGTTPTTWSVGAGTSGWGYRLKSGSAASTGTYATAWGADDTYAGKYAAVSASDVLIGEYTQETDNTGNDSTLKFGAEINATKIQATGTYTDTVTVTATTLP